MTVEEVKDQTCKDYLTSMFGIEVGNIDNDFKAFDENKDGIVSMQESTNALKNLVLDRTDIRDVWDVIKNNGFSIEYLDTLKTFLNFHIYVQFHSCVDPLIANVCVFNWSEFVDLLSDHEFKGELGCFATTAAGPRSYNLAVSSNLKYVELFMADQNMYVVCTEKTAA